MTMRWPGRAAPAQACSTSMSDVGRASNLEAPRGDLLDQGGQFGEELPGTDRALPAADDLQADGTERGGGDRRGRSGDRPDLDPGQRPGVVGAPGDDGGHRGGGGFAPEVVDHDVDLGGGLAEPAGDAVSVPVEQHGSGGAQSGQAGQPAGVAPGRDDLIRAEMPGDLDGHLAGVPGGPEDEHVLPGPERHPLAQRDPGGHGRVHGRGDQRSGRRPRAGRCCGGCR